MGADLVGIGSPDGWEGAPIQMDPRFIMPEAKSIITMGFRMMRGALRSIEEDRHSLALRSSRSWRPT